MLEDINSPGNLPELFCQLRRNALAAGLPRFARGEVDPLPVELIAPERDNIADTKPGFERYFDRKRVLVVHVGANAPEIIRGYIISHQGAFAPSRAPVGLSELTFRKVSNGFVSGIRSQ